MVKRPPHSTAAHHYLPCSYCYGFYHFSNINQHMRRCNTSNPKRNNSLSQCRAMMTPYIMSDDKIESDLDTCLGGLSETAKYPG